MRDEHKEFVGSISGLIEIGLTLQNLNKSLESSCGLSIVQWSVLKSLVERPAVSPLVLSKVLKVTPGTLSQSLTRLAKKDFLFMCDDPGDARKKMISITRKGKESLEMAENEYRKVFRGIDQVRDGIESVDGFLKNTVTNRARTNP